jgi:hypothetical protein
MQASRAVLELGGGAYECSMNHYSVGGNNFVTTLQVDEWIYVVGQDDFSVARYSLNQWLGREQQASDPQVIECDDAVQALELLNLMRQDALVWQCGGCDGWIYTSDRPRIGVLQCSTCSTGGVDFRHADRHVGGE